MLDNILYFDEKGLVLDIEVVNSGSSQSIVYDTLMQSVEGTVGGDVDWVLYDILFQTLESTGGSGSCNGDITSETIITIPKRYIERINNLSIYTP